MATEIGSDPTFRSRRWHWRRRRRKVGSDPGATAIAPRASVAGTLALLLLELLWELVLAPLGGHPSWLALKALPLAVLLPGVARGATAQRQWLALLLPFYAAEAFTRAYGEHGRHALVAVVACVVAVATFVALLVWLRGDAAGRR